MELWKQAPGMAEETPKITAYIPEEKKTDAAIVIFPGGGYCVRAPHEGEGYAKFFMENGICSFVVDYRVAPHTFPLELLDARRAVRYVRAHASEYGIDKNKIAVMGSSAGGHLAALVSTYRKDIEFEGLDEIDEESPFPNAQILCYPVICSPAEEKVTHGGSYWNLLGGRDTEKEKELDPSLNVSNETPQAFIWHTSDDQAVNVINSYKYATELRNNEVATEMHIFPHAPHGVGLAEDRPHVAQWSGLLLNWLKEIGWM